MNLPVTMFAMYHSNIDTNNLCFAMSVLDIQIEDAGKSPAPLKMEINVLTQETEFDVRT